MLFKQVSSRNVDNEISYKKALDGNYKALRQLFGDFSQSYTEVPHLFLTLKQANPRCFVIWKNI